MALLNINDLISQYAMQSGILNSQGQIAPAPQSVPNTGGLVNSPGLSQALLSLGSTVAQANQAGYGFGGALAMGANSFGNALQAEKDKIAEAEKQATQERLAAMKDIIGLQTQQQELGLRMQAASLARRAQQDALDSRSQERQAAEQRRQAILNSGDENLIKAYQIGGDDLAKEIFKDTIKPKTPNTQGLPEGYMWGADGAATPIPGVTIGPKTTEGSEKARKLAEEGLNALTDYKSALYDPDGSINRTAINFGEITSEGRDLLQPLRTAVGNNIYLKTGAAATPGEIDEQLKQYQPSRFDTQEQIERKARSLEQFLQSNAPNYTPTGNAAKAIRPNAQTGFTYLGVEE